MASWRVIEQTGRTLVSLIERRLTELGILNVTVSIATPDAFAELASTDTARISLFLFQITPNAEMRNLPQPVRPDGTYRRHSLPLELCYLVTAWGVRGDTVSIAGDNTAALEEARLFGAILQGFYDNAEVGRGDLIEAAMDPVWAPDDGLQIVMETLPTESHYRFWDAGESSFRLSVVYRVRVTALDPADAPPAPPVTSADMEMVS